MDEIRIFVRTKGGVTELAYGARVLRDLDELIVPTANARLDHPDLQVSNVPVRAVGHVSLPMHGRVVGEVCRVLRDAHVAEPLAAA